MNKKTIFGIFATFFLIAAIYHIIGAFYPINTDPLWRDLVFVGINILVAYGLLKRPGFFIYVFILLMLQQFYSHGSELIKIWNLDHKIDWISVLVLVMLPIILVFLILDKKGKLK